MKRVFIASGIITAIIALLFLSGVLVFRDSKAELLAKGNREFDSGNYTEAFEVYYEGLSKFEDDPELSYNAGQALYCMDDWLSAAEYYSRSTLKNVDRYLNMGNCNVKIGDVFENADEYADDSIYVMLGYYRKALEAYRQGIVAFPQEISLKYNYEYVKEKIRQLEQEIARRQQEETDRQSDEGKRDDKEQKDGGDQQGNVGQQGGGQQEGGDQQGGGGPQDGDDRQTGGGPQDGDDKQTEGGQSGDDVESSGDGRPGDDDEPAIDDRIQTRREIEYILQMIEKQEKESLKNNQGSRFRDEGEEYDW